MTEPKSQSGRLTAARLKEITERVNRDGQLRLTLSCDDLRSILCELQRMKAVLKACAQELHYAVDMQDDYSMTDAGRCALKQADEILNAALLTDAPDESHCLCEFAVPNWDGVRHDRRCHKYTPPAGEDGKR